MNVSSIDVKFKEQLFVEAYAETFHGGVAAEKAGYSAKGAWNRASMLLRKPHIQQALKERLKLTLEHQKLKPSYVLDGLREIFERCMQIKPVVISGVVQKGKFRFSPTQAIRALELLGKNFNMFTPDVVVNLNIELDKELSVARTRALELMKAKEQIRDITGETDDLGYEVANKATKELKEEGTGGTTIEKQFPLLV